MVYRNEHRVALNRVNICVLRSLSFSGHKRFFRSSAYVTMCAWFNRFFFFLIIGRNLFLPLCFFFPVNVDGITWQNVRWKWNRENALSTWRTSLSTAKSLISESCSTDAIRWGMYARLLSRVLIYFALCSNTVEDPAAAAYLAWYAELWDKRVRFDVVEYPLVCSFRVLVIMWWYFNPERQHAPTSWWWRCSMEMLSEVCAVTTYVTWFIPTKAVYI